MGALDKFMGSPKEITVDGVLISIKPLKVKDMAKITKQNPTPEESLEIAKNILKLSIEGVTDENIEELPLDKYVKIIGEINKFNGFEDEHADRIKAAIAARQK